MITTIECTGGARVAGDLVGGLGARHSSAHRVGVGGRGLSRPRVDGVVSAERMAGKSSVDARSI